MASRRFLGTIWRRRMRADGTRSLVVEHDDGIGGAVGMASTADAAESEAVANLMAAAPEMYTALANVRSLLRSAALAERIGILLRPGKLSEFPRPSNQVEDKATGAIRRLLEQIDAVMAKAEGKP